MEFFKKDHYADLLKGLKNIVNLHYKIIAVGDNQIIGYGVSSGPEYPQYKEDIERLKPKELKQRKEDYQRIHKRVSKLFDKSSKPVIFLSHNVPFNTKIDMIVNKDSPRDGHHFGSIVTREMIDKYKPLICIGGHMHEHFGKCKIRKTIYMNTGFGSYVNTFLEVEGNKIKELEFHKGKGWKHPYH